MGVYEYMGEVFREGMEEDAGRVLGNVHVFTRNMHVLQTMLTIQYTSLTHTILHHPLILYAHSWKAECLLALEYCQSTQVASILALAGNINIYDIRKGVLVLLLSVSLSLLVLLLSVSLSLLLLLLFCS